jgi:hypothetical protein
MGLCSFVFYVQLIGLWNISGKPWIDCHIKNVGTKPLYIFSVIPCNNFVGFLSTSIGCQSSYSSFVRILMVQFNLGTPHCLKKWLNANNPMRKIIRVPFSVEFSWASPAWKNTPKTHQNKHKITFTNIQHKIISSNTINSEIYKYQIHKIYRFVTHQDGPLDGPRKAQSAICTTWHLAVMAVMVNLSWYIIIYYKYIYI